MNLSRKELNRVFGQSYVALVVSKKPIANHTKFVGDLGHVWAADAGKACTLQCSYLMLYDCFDPGGGCRDSAVLFYNRWCCEAGSSICETDYFPWYIGAPCYSDPVLGCRVDHSQEMTVYRDCYCM